MIYLKLDKQPNTIKNLLKKLFSNCRYHSNINSCNSYDDCELTNIATYYDPECTKKECGPARYRSIDAVLEIVRTYFSKATDKQIFKALFNLKIKNEFVLQMIDCSYIKRPTMYFTCYPDHEWCEFNKLSNSNYSWKMIWKSLGFKNIKDVQKHLYKLKGE